jgi:hypothetical protein
MTEPTERVRELLRHTANHIPGGPVTVPGPDLITSVAAGRRRRGHLLAAVFVVVLLAVAAPVLALSRREPQPPSTSSPPTTNAPTASDCGTYQLGQGEELPRSAIRCFEQALASGRPAVLTFSRPTTEGDPIVLTYRSDSTGRVDEIIDTTRDRWGPQRVVRRTCTGAVPGTMFTFTECSELTPTTP